MQIKVEIPDELAAKLQTSGLSAEEYVRNLIEEAVREQPLDSNPSARKMRMEQFLREMAANSEKMPVLPDEALTRASFYQDHD